MCFLLAPSCWFHEKLHEFLMLESPSWFWWFGGWLSSTLRFLPKKEQDWKSSTLMCSNSSSNVEVWLGKWRLGWPFALLYKWKMMWTLAIAGFLALSINSIFFISIASRFVNIQNSDVFAYRFWAVKARSVFLSWPVSRPPFWDFFAGEAWKKKQKRVFLKVGGWEAVSTKPFLDELGYENQLTCHPKQVAQSQALAQQLTRQMARILEQEWWWWCEVLGMGIVQAPWDHIDCIKMTKEIHILNL